MTAVHLCGDDCPDDVMTCPGSEALPAPNAANARAAVDPVRNALDTLDRDLVDLTGQMSTEDLTLFLGLVQVQQKRIAIVEAYIAQALAAQLDSRDTRWPDGMRAERSAVYRDTWDRRGTAEAVTADLRDNPDEAFAKGARSVLARLLACARQEFRVTEVRPFLGQDLDQFLHRERTHYRVKVTLPTQDGAS